MGGGWLALLRLMVGIIWYTVLMIHDVQFLTSALLTDAGIKHGWFTRFGGVSTELFESLNGKKGAGDTDDNVDKNRKRALVTFCHPEPQACRHSMLDSGSYYHKDFCPCRNDNSVAHIVHQFKNNILEAEEAGEFRGYDASLTTEKDLVLSHTTADCGTVIIADTKGTIVALIHGSWHTLSTKLIRDTVAKIKMYTPNKLIAGIGPMICKNCYEFGPEALDLFEPKYLELKFGKYFVDLKQMIIDQLTESEITKIDDIKICTLEDTRFFSHRRSGMNSGRFITLVRL